MKRHLASILLALCLALGCALPAFAAAGFDESVLKNAQDIRYIEYEEDGTAVYFVESLQADERWYWTADGDNALLVYPCVYVEDGKQTYNLCFLYDARSELELQNVYINIGGKYYVFRNVDNDAEWYKGSGSRWWISELGCAELDADSLAVLDALVAHRSEAVTVTLEGEEDTVSITLGQPELDGIIHLYNLYTLAGGLREENLQAIPRGSGTEFSIREAAA